MRGPSLETHRYAIKFVLMIIVGSVVISDQGVEAFSLAPIRFDEPRGIFVVRNSLPGVARVEIKVYPPTASRDGKSWPANTPLPDEETDQLIRLRPSSFRLGSNAVRNVNYKLIDATTPARFFVCAETTQGIAKLRICSRWAPSP